MQSTSMRVSNRYHPSSITVLNHAGINTKGVHRHDHQWRHPSRGNSKIGDNTRNFRASPWHLGAERVSRPPPALTLKIPRCETWSYRESMGCPLGCHGCVVHPSIRIYIHLHGIDAATQLRTYLPTYPKLATWSGGDTVDRYHPVHQSGSKDAMRRLGIASDCPNGWNPSHPFGYHPFGWNPNWVSWFWKKIKTR